MYSDEVQRMRYAADRRRAFNLQSVHETEEVQTELIAATVRLTQRTITGALLVNLVADEAQRIDPKRAQQYEALASAGIFALARTLTGE